MREVKKVVHRELYRQGADLEGNPAWHVEDSPWKAEQIIKMRKRNDIRSRTVCKVGCRAGEVLRQLQLSMDGVCMFQGYEISPQTFDLSKKEANKGLEFELRDILEDEEAFFDLVLVINVIEHLEDYFSFLRMLRSKGEYKLFHIPLYLSVQAVLRSTPLIIER